VLPRRVPGAALAAESTSHDQGRPVKPVKPVAAESTVTTSSMREVITRGEVDIRARRRRMLLGLIGLAVLWAGFAAFWQPVLWWPQILLDLVVFSYVVFLRLEAQREQERQERRQARATARVTLPEDRTEREVRKHTQYRQHVTAATGHGAIGIDDDDPSFAEMPTYVAAPSSRVAADADDAPAWQERKAV